MSKRYPISRQVSRGFFGKTMGESEMGSRWGQKTGRRCENQPIVFVAQYRKSHMVIGDLDLCMAWRMS